MILSASIDHDFSFSFSPVEQPYLDRMFIDSTVYGSSRRLSIYDGIPDYMIIGNEYTPNAFFSGVAPKTMRPKTTTEFLRLHGLCVSWQSGEIVSIASLSMPDWQFIGSDNGYITANHIPQVFCPFQDSIIKSVSGEWDGKRRYFRGIIEVGEID